MKPQLFTRNPFDIEAVQVTAENIEEVATWCGGAIKMAKATEKRNEARFIQVDVTRPLNDRQRKAFPGDWVLRSGGGFKVYTPKAFKECFSPKVVYTDADADAQLGETPTKNVFEENESVVVEDFLEQVAREA